MKYVSILRLLGVGSVKDLSYTITTDAILNSPMSGGTITSPKTHQHLNYYIPKDIEQNIIDFFSVLNSSLPLKFYSFDKDINHLTIAFERYSEGLLENVIFERRVANIVMGIEALFSKSRDELSFRLSLYISKVMSLLGFQSISVFTTIKKAYDIRSTFAHGSHISKKDLLIIKKTYGSESSFLSEIANYLRICIVTYLVTGLTKDKLLDKINVFAIDNAAAQQLSVELKKLEKAVLQSLTHL